jgi:DNA-binding HxlR family transcriptional regulator
MSVKRRYGDSCGIARALDVVGERWALLVVRELLLGPKRFSDLRQGLGRIGPDMLALRLRDLEGAGIVARRGLPAPAARTVYELTDHGRELEPVLQALGRWGSGLGLGQDPPPLSPDAAVVALQTMYSPGPDAPPAAIGLRLDGHEFALQARPDRLEASAGAPDAPAAVVETDSGTLAAVLWHGLDPTEAAAGGRFGVTGDDRAAWAVLDRCG